MPDSLTSIINASKPAAEKAAHLLHPGAVYAKTARGHEEVSLRSYGLTPKQRRVLIMMNGKKDLATIAGFIPVPELREAVPFLLAEMFISEATESSGETGQAHAAVDGGVNSTMDGTASTGDGSSPSGAKAEERAALAPIKEMMTGAARLHLGLLASDIVRRIDNASDRAALQAAAGYWHVAILESKTGGSKAGVYLEEVRRAIAAL